MARLSLRLSDYAFRRTRPCWCSAARLCHWEPSRRDRVSSVSAAVLPWVRLRATDKRLMPDRARCRLCVRRDCLWELCQGGDGHCFAGRDKTAWFRFVLINNWRSTRNSLGIVP